MRYTNNKNLPDAICRAIMWAQSRHQSAPGSYGSVTELNGPPLIRWLRRHYSENEAVSIDFSRMTWILDGVFAHELFEKHGVLGEGVLYETTMSFTVGVDVVGERSPQIKDEDFYRISFTPDLVSFGTTLQDYKKTSVYNVEKTVKTGEVKRDWEEQLNVYIEGLTRNQELIGPFSPEKAEIVAWMRDWGPRHMSVSDSAFKKINVPIWDRKRTCDHIVSRLRKHAKADMIAPWEGVPEPCTREERWHKTAMESSFVPGPRCKGYCDYATVCPYVLKYNEKKEAGDTPDSEDN